MAIQQHPVPQDISNYKFRLIGDMTIKQFAALGISIVLSVIIYSSPLPFFFKYPLSFFLLLLGVGTAFIPFQGRTLDVWIVAFIKSIYSPTQYIWKHGQNTPAQTTDNSQNPQTPVVTVSAPAADQTPTANTPTETPGTAEPAATPAEPTPVETQPTKPTDSTANTQVNNIPTPQPQADLDTSTDQTSADTLIPQVNPPVQGNKDAINTNEQSTTNNEQSLSSLPIPFTPTVANTLVGLTLNSSGQILDGVLVEIKNQNITVRATKSNKLGQFLFVRPLENGLYQILAEKDGFTFDNYSIQLNGEIINPLRIQATN